ERAGRRARRCSREGPTHSIGSSSPSATRKREAHSPSCFVGYGRAKRNSYIGSRPLMVTGRISSERSASFRRAVTEGADPGFQASFTLTRALCFQPFPPCGSHLHWSSST